jgi:DNA-3-methyladenine glycosylase
MKLPYEYYQQQDVVAIAKDLIGKVLCTYLDNQFTSGIITETEAYAGIQDKASHAYGGKRTKRNEVMYHAGGKAYVYLCYGMHTLFNVVTNTEGIPHAVLIRGIYPLDGIPIILQRRKAKQISPQLTLGPGKVTQALGIHLSHNGLDLTQNILWIEDRKIRIPENAINIGKRVGIDYAEEDALLPYRFYVDSKNLSPNCF